MHSHRWIAAAAALSLAACNAASTNRQEASRNGAAPTGEQSGEQSGDKLAPIDMRADASYLTDEER